LIEHGFTSVPTQYRLYGRRVNELSKFLTAHQHKAIQCHSCWFTLENTGQKTK